MKFNSIGDLKDYLKEEQSDQAQYLNIYTINYNVSMKTQYQQMQSSHDIQQFTLFINKMNLNNYFINNLMEIIQNWKSLKDMNILLDSNQVSKKQAIRFILFIKRMFYPREFVTYSFIAAGYIQLKCNQCIIRFKNDINQNFSFKNLKLKLITFKFDSEKGHFQNLIKNEIKRNNDQLCVKLYHQDNLVVQCYNIKKNKQQIRLIFDNLDELLQFSIKDHKIAIIKLRLDCTYFERIQQTKIIEQISERYNFKCSKNSELTILSLENNNDQTFLSYFIKKTISKYFFNNQTLNFFLANEFKLQQFKEILFPNVLSQCTLKQFTIHFFIKDENYEEDKYKIFKLSNKENKQEQKKRFNINLNCIKDSLNLLKHFFTTIQSEEYKYLSLKIYDIKNEENQKKLAIQLENLDVNMDIKKLKVQNSFKLPFISKLNSLQKIHISAKGENIELFLLENKQLMQTNKMLKELILNNLRDYYQEYSNYNFLKNISLHQFTTLKLKQDVRNEFDASVMKLQRLVSFTVRKQKEDRNQKKFINYIKMYECNGIGCCYHYDNYQYYYYGTDDYILYHVYSQTYHDNIDCGYSNMKNCTCHNFEMQKILHRNQKSNYTYY